MSVEIHARLDQLEELIKYQTMHTKVMLNIEETSKYLDLSISHLYKMTSRNEIAYYKPSGKKLYFKREELDAWMQQNRSTTSEEMDQIATDYVYTQKRFK